VGRVAGTLGAAPTRMSIRRTSIITFGVTVFGIAVEALLPHPPSRPRSCGHPRTLCSRISSLTHIRLGATHCCGSYSMIADLRAIDGAMEAYRIDRGRYATSFDQLTNDYPMRLRFDFRLISDGKRWSVAVPEQGVFPGHYLLTSDNRLHFSTRGPATTNDLDLWDMR